ncbi:MAG TPA: MFS transporter [Steroidobacteraceae bacterium]|nr:MFS transporter [Steroidobacteraceae bacterium]
MSPAATAGERTIDRQPALLALLLVGSVTEAIFLILPSFVGAVGDLLHLSPLRTGLLGSADLAGIALSTATAAWWLRRVSWRRTVGRALALFAVLNGLCFLVRGFYPLIGLRLAAGVAAGVAYAVALAGIVDTRRADRNAGLLLCMQVVFSAIGLYVADVVPPQWRLDIVYGYILIWLAPTLLICWRVFPENPGGRPRSDTLQWRLIAGPGAAALLGAGLYFLMIGAVWGYLEGVARGAGLTLEQTGSALSAGLVLSLAGSAAAALIGVRFGRILPLAATALFQIVALVLLTRLGHYARPAAAFFWINTVFQIFWSYVIAYFIIIFNDVDASGRFVAFYGTASHLMLAVGPYVGALLIEDGGYTLLLGFGVVATTLCYASFIGAARLSRPKQVLQTRITP